VIGLDGSAPLVPLPGVIVTTGPAGDGLAEADAGPADAEAGWAVPLGPDFSMMVVVLPVQAVSTSANAPAATAETTRIALMATLY
jgi:hypothetical protein